jgi:hypothetical protein
MEKQKNSTTFFSVNREIHDDNNLLLAYKNHNIKKSFFKQWLILKF